MAFNPNTDLTVEQMLQTCNVAGARPKTAPEGLRVLADWFDAVYQDEGKGDAVQQDLRRWADEFARLQAIADRLSKTKAPPKCFAPAPKPLVVDDVVEVIAENSRLQKQTRVVTRVYENGDVALGDVVFRPHEVRRIGHM